MSELEQIISRLQSLVREARHHEGMVTISDACDMQDDGIVRSVTVVFHPRLDPLRAERQAAGVDG